MECDIEEGDKNISTVVPSTATQAEEVFEVFDEDITKIDPCEKEVEQKVGKLGLKHERMDVEDDQNEPKNVIQKTIFEMWGVTPQKKSTPINS